MSDPDPPSTGKSKLGQYFKSVIGYPAYSPGPANSQPSPPNTNAPPQVLTPLKVPHPSPREQSVPELVSTPSDIGIWEVSHEMRGKFSWRRLFQDPSTFEAASPKK